MFSLVRYHQKKGVEIKDIAELRAFGGTNLDKHECSARDWERSGLLGGIPRVVVQISALL
jgi:hypothetical protein